jgi:plastocyanin
VITAAIGLVVALSACGNGPPEGAVAGGGGGASIGSAAASGLGTASKTVSATTDLKFDPNAVTVKTGDVVEWKVADGSPPHNVTFDEAGSLTSPALNPGDTWQVKITVAGTYPYHCTFHPGMDGQITVGG